MKLKCLIYYAISSTLGDRLKTLPSGSMISNVENDNNKEVLPNIEATRSNFSLENIKVDIPQNASVGHAGGLRVTNTSSELNFSKTNKLVIATAIPYISR